MMLIIILKNQQLSRK